MSKTINYIYIIIQTESNIWEQIKQIADEIVRRSIRVLELGDDGQVPIARCGGGVQDPDSGYEVRYEGLDAVSSTRPRELG